MREHSRHKRSFREVHSDKRKGTMRYLTAVAALGLLLAVTATAEALTNTAGDVHVGVTHGASAAWTPSSSAVGSSSLQLNWPPPYYEDPVNNTGYTVPRAFARIDIPSGLALNDIEDWSYWAKAPEDYVTNLTFYLDTDSDAVTDTTVTAWPENDPPLADTWMQVDEKTIGGYDGSYVIWSDAAYPSWEFNWASITDGYGDASLLGLKLGKGVIGTSQPITTYVDDFSWTVGGVTRTWEFEGTGAIPEPVTLAGLALGVGALGGYLRRRNA